MTQAIFDLVSTTLKSLNVALGSVSVDNYVAAFQFFVAHGKIQVLSLR